MELDAWRNFFRVSREFHCSSFFVRVWASEDYVGKVLRFLLAANAELSYIESAVPEALSAEAGFQGSKIRATCCHVC
eukprot:5181818-Amphidinium_carterae.2